MCIRDRGVAGWFRQAGPGPAGRRRIETVGQDELEYSTLATSFCRPEFTVAELRAVYDAAWGQRLDPANFHRKVMASDGFVIATGRRESAGPGRPAGTFVAGPAEALSPPISRS